MKHKSACKRLLDTVVNANEADLIRMSAGNISLRMDDGLIAITPSGVSYRTMTIDDIAIIDLDGAMVEGPKPSSETPMHTVIYRDLAAVGSICHTHSPYAITFAMLGEDIPTANIELMACGAPIPVTPWACPGTSKAGEVAVEIFGNRSSLKVILLRSHGLVAIGASVENAFETAYKAEVGLGAYHRALQVGKPKPITDAQIAEIRATYQGS